MEFALLAHCYERIEQTPGRLEMAAQLVGLLQQTPAALLPTVVYLTQGQLGAAHEGIETGLAEKNLLKAILRSAGGSKQQAEQLWVQTGDLGTVVESLLAQGRALGGRQTTLTPEPLTIEGVLETLRQMATTTGAGSQDVRIRLAMQLLTRASPLEARYLCRILVGRLRLGLADMTIVDALAIAFATKEQRDVVEHAFNITSDLGVVASVLSSQGVDGLGRLHIQPGVPIRPMLAERLNSLDAIVEKVGSDNLLLEYKFDGLRLQAHVRADGQVALFSRRLEPVTAQFPDVCAALQQMAKGRAMIVEGECVPIEPQTGELLPFQVVSRRRGRKVDLQEAIAQVPVRLVLFDCLADGTTQLLSTPLVERRATLERLVGSTEELPPGVGLTRVLVRPTLAQAQEFFSCSLSDGAEGIMAKDLRGAYTAGARGWQWIKFKREYRAEMVDTVDLVVVGAYSGKGKRTGWYGALLMAAVNPDTGLFETVCKLGTGFTEEVLAALPPLLGDCVVPLRDPRVRSSLPCDVHLRPQHVLEVIGAELTRSPVHPAGADLLEAAGAAPGGGLAIRFPRFTGRVRDDEKGPQQATTTLELVDMYQRQLQRRG